MRTLYLERSVGNGRNGNWVESLDLADVGRIVVGTGPGSFAGIRSALAFAQGYALGSGCEVLGLPSACAVAALAFSTYADRLSEDRRLAVLGDARQGKIWIALFDGFRPTGDVFQVEVGGLSAAVPADCKIVTPDVQRIDGLLRETFGERYLGGQAPAEDGLRLFAEACPEILKSEPLPIYLNPAVRS